MTKSARRAKVIKHLMMASVLTIGISATLPQQVAFAYSGSNAAAYAETWWNHRNTQNYPTFTDDCTNFVSQALHDYHGGNFSYVNVGQDSSSDYNWWVQLYLGQGGVWKNSRSWSFAHDLYNFLLWHYPGGIQKGEAASYAQQTVAHTPSGTGKGDVLFYDWGGGDGISHATIEVGSGADPHSSYSGSYIDEHTSNRQHAFWSLIPYNSQWPTTTIYFVHIDPTNS